MVYREVNINMTNGLNARVMRIRRIIATTLMFIIIMGLIGVFSTSQVNAAEKDVASVTIFSDGSGDSWGTHAFLYIKNTSKSNISVLSYSLKPGKGMTVGTYGNQNEGSGIYINLEAYYVSKYDAYSPRVSLTTNVTSSQLKTLNKTMKKNNKWSYPKNCSWFAVKAWNSIAPKNKRLSAGLIKNPASLSKQIKKKAGYEKKKKIDKVDTEYVKRYKTNGKASSVSSKTKKNGKSSSGRSSR